MDGRKKRRSGDGSSERRHRLCCSHLQSVRLLQPCCPTNIILDASNVTQIGITFNESDLASLVIKMSAKKPIPLHLKVSVP
jgi:hypothetical protein